VPGISGLGVQIRSAKDVVQVPDEPQFTVDSRVAVAAWVNPSTVTGDQPIVIKRLQNRTSFSLGVHNGNVEMSVVTTSGQTFISRAPIAAGAFSHVAGMYDGTFVFLFINGQQVGQVFVGGALRDVFAPIRIGATTQTQHFDGVIDDVFVSTRAISKDELTALSCIHHASTFTVNPAASGPVSPGTTVHYDVAVTNHDVGACQPKQYDGFLSPPDPTITALFDGGGFFPSVAPGRTVTFGADVTGTDDTSPGVHQLPFFIDAFTFTPTFTFEQLSGQLTFELAEPTGCFVRTQRELMITSTGVVDDPVRASGSGVWTFGHLVREMAPTPEDAPALASKLFKLPLTDQTINGLTVAARPAMQQVLLDIWPKTASGDLDLDKAPMRLQAVVNRIDMRDLSAGSAGEGRFVFGVNDPTGGPQDFTIILEYNLPAKTQQDVLDWANRWHDLSSHPFPSEEYNAALEKITRLFADRGAGPGGVNGSALAELRTNEAVLSPFHRWELRGFALSPASGFFEEVTVKETPDLGFNGTSALADFVNQNAAAIEAVLPGANGNTVPAQRGGTSFLAGSVFNDLVRWSAPGINDPDARFHQSLNTCNGCHGPETNSAFLMVVPRFPGGEAGLSPFLTGTSVFDPFTGQTRTLNDLGRRNSDLKGLVCGAPGAAPRAGAKPNALNVRRPAARR